MSVRKSAAIVWSACVLACSLGGQVILNSDNQATAGQTRKNVVKDGAGILYSLSVSEDVSGNRPLLLLSSSDGGQTWSTVPFTFNDASSGLNPPNPTNRCSLAIDDQGRLHATWGFNMPNVNYYRQYYRNYDPATATASAIANIGSVTGAGTAQYYLGDLAVDGAGTVWITAQGSSGLTEKLVRSTMPYAQGLTFQDLGILVTSGTSQRSQVVIDVLGLVHVVSGSTTTGIWHRIYNPASGWVAGSTQLGNNTTPNDLWAAMCADSGGRVHAVIALDNGGGTAVNWPFWYRVWEQSTGWSAPITIFTLTPAEYTGVTTYNIVDIACDESSGTAYVVYRDIAAGGQLRIAQKGLTDPGFTAIADLTAPSLNSSEYNLPRIRGTLHPASNNTGTSLDITWRHQPPTSPRYSLTYLGLDVGTPAASISLGGAPIIGTTTSLELSSLPNPGAPYVCGLSLADTPGILLSDGRTIPLNFDDILVLTLQPGNGILSNNIATLDLTGQASVGFAIPNFPPLIGFTVYGAFVTADVLAPTGVGAISNALPIQFL